MPVASHQHKWMEKLHSVAHILSSRYGLSSREAHHAVAMALAWRWLADEQQPVQAADWCNRWYQAQRLVGRFFHSFADWPIDQTWDEVLQPICAESLPSPAEQLLAELHQQALDDQSRGDRGRRKSQGSFYTPQGIVESLLTPTLHSWSRQWAERWQSAGRVQRTLLTEELAGFRVLDPACGAGAFLLAAWEQLTTLWQMCGSQQPAQDALTNIYGWDQDGDAIELLRFFIAVRLLGRGADAATAFRVELEVGDFLLYRPAADERVNLVVGNPPWVRAKHAVRGTSPEQRRRLLDQLRLQFPELAQGELNLYTLFISRALDWLKPAGRLAFITPNSFLLDRNSVGLRQRITKDFTVEALTPLAERQCRKLFPGVNQAAVLMRLQRPEGQTAGVPQQKWWKALPHTLMALGTDEELNLVGRLLQGPTIGEQYQITDGEVHLTKHRAWISDCSASDDARPLIRGSDIRAYGLKGQAKSFSVTPEGEETSKRIDDRRILCQRIANQHMSHRLKGALVERVAAANSTISIVPKSHLAVQLIEQTLVLLHSDLYNWLLYMLSSDNNIPAWKLKLFPWQPPIGLFLGQDSAEMNRHLYKLFGITAAEQAIIEARLQ